jgi:hypothetical protein
MCTVGRDNINFCAGYITALIDTAPTGSFGVCTSSSNAVINQTIGDLARVILKDPQIAKTDGM